MDLVEVIYKRRTIRRFKQEEVSVDILKKLIDLARVAPAGNNVQSVEYIIILDPKLREKVFPLTMWAGSLPEKERTPEEGRRPMAYIVVLVNTGIKSSNADFDLGAAIENLLLGAVSLGLGCCWMGSVSRKPLRRILEIPEEYDIKHVISLGYPDEESVLETYKGSFKYWKDEKGVMHVPKRSVKDLIFRIY